MSRYVGPKFKIIRRLGDLSGLTSKSLSNKKLNKKKSSQYGLRLETKQKVRFHYGITEKQLIRYVQKARGLKGSTSKLLLILLEMRLDNTIFRSGLAPTIAAARQLISHGHVFLNSKKMNIPSYQCQIHDHILITKKQLDENSNKINFNTNNIPSHLRLNNQQNQITILEKLRPQEIGLKLNELLIIEYYSRS